LRLLAAPMTVKDIRLKWPLGERVLEHDREIVVMRDSKPLARILPYRCSLRRGGW